MAAKDLLSFDMASEGSIVSETNHGEVHIEGFEIVDYYVGY